MIVRRHGGVRALGDVLRDLQQKAHRCQYPRHRRRGCPRRPGRPPTRPGAQWHAEIDSYDPAAAPVGMGKHQAGDQVTVGPRSITVLRGLLAGVMCITG